MLWCRQSEAQGDCVAVHNTISGANKHELELVLYQTKTKANLNATSKACSHQAYTGRCSGGQRWACGAAREWRGAHVEADGADHRNQEQKSPPPALPSIQLAQV